MNDRVLPTMDLLLTNDDGIHAPGIRTLHRAVSDLGGIRVVAPSEEQSAVGHAITIYEPIKMHNVEEADGFSGYAVRGTPADCVKLALCELFVDDPPDFVISGVNLGPNAGISVTYSGTVSAATEGTIMGIPSMALSLDTFTDPHWDTAAEVARYMTQKLLANPLPRDVFLNVNIPNLPLNDLKGYAITHTAKSRFIEKFHKRTDPRNNTYFWLDGEMELLADAKGTDVEALQNGFVSVTPIRLDVTEHSFLEALKSWDF